ncbi:BRO family protein [Paenibacillus sp. V4I9]|nr:BRO family protein [Paenibacillus sp. V4I9]
MEKPWWVAKDVCDVLKIKNTTQALERLEVTMFNKGGQHGETNFVNES